MQPVVLPFDQALEQSWRTLQRRLRLLKRFGFIVLFVRDAALAQSLKQKLVAWLPEAQGSLLEVAEPGPESFSERSLLSVFEALRGGSTSVIWLEAFRGAGQPAWDQQRRELLSRLNERRSRLESELAGALILLLPEDGLRDAACMAPDLWHVRIHTDCLISLPGAGVLETKRLTSDERDDGVEASTVAGGVAAESAWDRQWSAEFGQQALSTVAADDARWLNLSLWDGFESVQALRVSGKLAAARALAEQLVLIARKRVDLLAGEGSLDFSVNRARRELSVSLNNIGRVGQAQGDWARAAAAYEEGLQLRRDLVQRLGGTPEALRDLSVSLDNIGQVAQAQADWSLAAAAYEESLQLSRDLVQRLGGTPEALRDLSISLNNSGQVAQAQGDWSRAAAAYEEGLQLRRDLVRRLGGTPEELRDLCVSLNNIGQVAQAQGDWARAAAAYEESLQLSRALVRRLGGTPEALRDLSVSLDNTGRVAQAQGDWARAAAAYEESLQLSRDLAQLLGGAPEALRDLSISLNNIGRVARAQGDWARAATMHQEGLQLARTLVERSDDAMPLAVEDLGRVLLAGAALPGADDKAIRAEAEQIFAALVKRYPGVESYASQLAELQAARPALASTQDTDSGTDK